MERFTIHHPADYSHLMYYGYSNWTEHNRNFYSTVPAYQHLNQHVESTNFEVKQNDLELEPELRLQSPTQARDFKLTCEGCKRDFTSKKRLENHLVKCKVIKSLETKPFSCNVCKKRFKKRASLLRHSELIHPGIENSEPPANVNKKPSIFHSIHLLAQSDSNFK